MERYMLEYNDNKKDSYITLKDVTNGDYFKLSKSGFESDRSFDFNQELCDILFKIDDTFYKYFPIKYRSDDMTLKMIHKYKSEYYEYYPEKFRDFDMTIEYIRKSGACLSHVPNEFISQELCDLFIIANPMSLIEIPKEYVKNEYIDYILIKGYSLGVIPMEYRTFYVCTRFIEADRSNLAFVPDDVLSEMCDIMTNNELAKDDDNSWMLSKIRIRENIQKIIKD